MRAVVTAEFPGIPDRPSSTDTNVIARVAVEEFVTAKVDEIYLAFTRFVNTLRQEPTVRRLLPFVPEEEDIDELPPLQYIFEPDPETVLNEVIPRLIEVSVFQTILESKASAFSAQMVAPAAICAEKSEWCRLPWPPWLPPRHRSRPATTTSRQG